MTDCSPGLVDPRRFWNMLSYLVNTLIFVLVGLVIAHRAFSRVDSMDWVYLVVLYFGSLIIRSELVFVCLFVCLFVWFFVLFCFINQSGLELVN